MLNCTTIITILYITHSKLAFNQSKSRLHRKGLSPFRRGWEVIMTSPCCFTYPAGYNVCFHLNCMCLLTRLLFAIYNTEDLFHASYAGLFVYLYYAAICIVLFTTVKTNGEWPDTVYSPMFFVISDSILFDMISYYYTTLCCATVNSWVCKLCDMRLIKIKTTAAPTILKYKNIKI